MTFHRAVHRWFIPKHAPRIAAVLEPVPPA